jgi:HEAT repeat protein
MNWLEIWLVGLLAASGATQREGDEGRSANMSPSVGPAVSNASTPMVSALGGDPKRIAQGLKSKDEEKARGAVRELEALGSKGVPYLADALEFESAIVRREALLALGRLGDTAEAALPKLVAHSQAIGASGEATLPNAIFNCAIAGVGFERDMSSTFLAWSKGMDDVDKVEFDRMTQARLSVLAIARVGEARVPVLLELVAPLDRGAAPNEFTGPRIGLAFALARAIEDGPDEALAQLWPLLERSLSAERLSERMTALVAAGSAGKAAKREGSPIAKAVAARLKSEDATERAVAAAVLAGIDPSCETFGLQLEPLLADPAPYARVFAAVALRDICGGSPAVEDTFLQSLSADDETRAAALESIHGIDRKPSEREVGPITKCLDSKNDRVLVAALDALGSCGERAKGAVAKIKVLAKHKNGFVRRAADSALKRIR